MNGEIDAFDQTWDNYLKPMKAKVRERAMARAQEDGRQEIALPDAVEAIQEQVGIGTKSAASLTRSEGWFHKNVSGFIGITAVLAVIFGILGTLPATKDAASGLFEIAKMLAGALVGGAAGAAATSGARRP
jgi:hypothetical protein